MYPLLGPFCCPECPEQFIGKLSKRRVGQKLELIVKNYSGTGVDIVQCEKCRKQFYVTYKLDTLKEVEWVN